MGTSVAAVRLPNCEITHLPNSFPCLRACVVGFPKLHHHRPRKKLAIQQTREYYMEPPLTYTMRDSLPQAAFLPCPGRSMHQLRCSSLLFCLCLLAFISSCNGGKPAHDKNGPIRIGFSMDSVQLERWQRDRDLFVQRAKELGAEVLVQSADGNDSVQVRQAENLLTQAVDVLVVVPHNGEIAASIVDSARRQNVPVLAYDRIIRNSDLDFYISFDNVKVGELQAKYLFDRV